MAQGCVGPLFAILTLTPAIIAQQPAAWADKLFAGELTHDFGVIARGSQLKHAFKFTNIYKVPLDITEVRVSCGCVKAESSVKTVQPGESAAININMDARQFNGSKTVRVYVTVGPKFISTATLTVNANARGDVAFSPNEIDFGNLQRGQTPSKTIDIEYTGSLVDWRVVEIFKDPSAPFDLKVEALPRLVNAAARRGYRLTATLKADAPTGSFKQEVILKTNDASAATVPFNVVGGVQASLSVSPNPILVNGMKVGESVTKKVFVRSAKPFKILSVEGQGEGVTVDVPTRQDNSLVLTVTIAPTKAGALRRPLMIRTDLDSEMTPLIIEGTVEP